MQKKANFLTFCFCLSFSSLGLVAEEESTFLGGIYPLHIHYPIYFLEEATGGQLSDKEIQQIALNADEEEFFSLEGNLVFDSKDFFPTTPISEYICEHICKRNEERDGERYD